MRIAFMRILLQKTWSALLARSWGWDVSVFVAYFLTAKLAQYILYDLHTSPALIWAPTGIALAAVLLRGYEMWIPIAGAYFLAILTITQYFTFPAMIIATVGFTLQPIVGAWGFKKLQYDGTIHRKRNVAILVIGAFVIAAIGPMFNTVGQIVLHTLSETAWITFTRAWAGCVLSVIIVTPFITGWYYSPSFPIKRAQAPELMSAMCLLCAAIYAIFWSSMFSAFVFIFIFVLCISLFWIAFRFGSRVNTSAMLLLAIGSIAGSIIMNPAGGPLNDQLFIDELFLILIIPVFALFFTLSEEGRITEKELARKVKELELVTEQLSSNDRSKNEFIAILAHELRNPLSTMVSTLEVLKFESLSSDVEKLIEQSEQQTHVMRRLLDDLLDVARIAEQKFKILKEDVKLEDIISQSVEATQSLIRERGHTLTISLPSEELIMHVDPLRIQQVMTNLLNNAAKYTPPGGKISLICLIEPPGLRVRVCDSGIGIPAGQLEKLFVPFQQLQPAPHRTSGVGIGLFLSRQIVEMHGGTIEAYSAGEHGGSCFTVSIPLSRSKTSPAFDGENTRNVSVEIERDYRERILIVDDNQGVALGMSKLLMHKGYEIKVVHNGADAVRIFAEFNPEVVLLDIGLPDMSGYEVALRMRVLPRGARALIVAVTGYGQEEDKALASTAGCDYHFTKPVRVAELETVIRSNRVHDSATAT